MVQVMTSRRVIVVDIETTGLDVDTCWPLEISAVDVASGEAITGVAEVIGTSPRGVIVKCPHCRDTHTHARSLVGSNHVVAGCHTGYARCREYRVVDMGAGRGRR